MPSHKGLRSFNTALAALYLKMGRKKVHRGTGGKRKRYSEAPAVGGKGHDNWKKSPKHGACCRPIRIYCSTLLAQGSRLFIKSSKKWHIESGGKKKKHTRIDIVEHKITMYKAQYLE